MERLRSAYEAFRSDRSPVTGDRIANYRDDRMLRYALYSRAYEGISVRMANVYVAKNQAKRLKYNLHQPIVNIGAGWVAGPELGWKVEGSEALSQAAMDIWKRSGGDSEYLMAELSAGKLGDMCIVVRVDEMGKAFFDFVDPMNAYPEFDPIDPLRLRGLRICINPMDQSSPRYEEIWSDSQVSIQLGGGDPITEDFQFDATPAVWIPNLASGNAGFGDSDISSTLELVDEYNHLAEKQTRVFDIFGKPIPYTKGGKIDQAQFKDSLRTFLQLPKDGEVGMLEAKGTPPSMEAHLDRMRNTISEVSQIPAIAFGQVDSGFANATGISLKVLYGPLEDKTRRKRSLRGPRLGFAMYLALRAEGFTVDLEDVSCVWAESAPHNDTEAIANIEAKVRLGLSRKRALLELGYSPKEVDAIQQEAQDESQQRAETAAQTFNRGGLM